MGLTSIGFNEPVFFVPDRDCKASDPHPNIYFAGLTEDQTIITSPWISTPWWMPPQDFSRFRLEWGLGTTPASGRSWWKASPTRSNSPTASTPGTSTMCRVGKITLRIYLESTDERYAENAST